MNQDHSLNCCWSKTEVLVKNRHNWSINWPFVGLPYFPELLNGVYALHSMTTNEAQFEETMRIILDTARDSITSDFRVTKCEHRCISPAGRSFMAFSIEHERVDFGVSIVALHDHQVSTVNFFLKFQKVQH